jgi:hypothetical protein
MGSVVDFLSKSRVDDAWNDYTEYARMLSDDGTRLTDRAFHEEFTRRYDRWRKLFLMQDAR